MKLLLLTLGAYLLAINVSVAQSKSCGTDEAVKKQLLDHPELQAIRDSINLNRYSNLDAELLDAVNPIGAYELPALPGFTPSGDFQVDLINWQKAKKELFESNPELYKELTRDPNANKLKPRK